MAATKISVYNQTLQRLGDARLATLTDDYEGRYALDESWDEAVAFVLRQAPWRFALKTALLIASVTVIPGFTNGYAYPADWLRTHAIYDVSADGREHPRDLREQGAVIVTNSATPSTMRYVSITFADPAVFAWPEHFAQCVAAYLAFLVAERITGDSGAPARMSQLFASLLPEAIRIDAVPEDRWLPYQRTGAMLRGARFMLEQGGWRFAIKTVAAAGGGTPAPGYSNAFIRPADWVRTHTLFLSSSGREFPLDVREHDTQWSANTTAFFTRYISTAGLDATLWPDPFRRALLAWLDAEQAGEPVDKEGGVFQALLAAALDADALPPNPWLRFQLDGRYLRVAREIMQQGNWRFALKDAAISVQSGVPVSGFSFSFAQPADWLRTHKLFVSVADRELPIDIREKSGFWHTNVLVFRAQYVSSTRALDSTLWPEPLTNAALAYLQDDAPNEKVSSGDAGPLWRQHFAEALAGWAEYPDPWLQYQLEGSFLRGSRAVLGRGYWWWALKQLQIDASMQLPSQPDYGFPYRHALPADHFRTHALFVALDGKECPINIRETAQDWSTDAGGPPPGGDPAPPGSPGAFVARYVSTSVLDATGGDDPTKAWPELVAKSVLAYLDWQAAPVAESKVKQQEFDRLLAEALGAHSRGEDDWLRFQLNGSFRQATQMLLERGRWRFAVKSPVLQPSSDPLSAEFSDGTPSDSYAYRFIKPNDLLKTIWVYFVWGTGPSHALREDIDFRDEGGAFHAQRSPITVRYVSRRGLDSTTWPANFRRAVNACLLHLEQPDDLRRKELYEDAERLAEGLDDQNDMPPTHRVGRFVTARYGRGSISREQGWPRF